MLTRAFKTIARYITVECRIRYPPPRAQVARVGSNKIPKSIWEVVFLLPRFLWLLMFDPNFYLLLLLLYKRPDGEWAACTYVYAGMIRMVLKASSDITSQKRSSNPKVVNSRTSKNTMLLVDPKGGVGIDSLARSKSS